MALDENTQLLREIRNLLQVIAEPQIATRDKRLRDELQKIVGTSTKKAKAILAMDGSKNQSTLRKESGMDVGNLSRLVKSPSPLHVSRRDLRV